MNLFKKLFFICVVAVFYNTEIVPSSYDVKQFAFQNLDKIAKYQMFTRGIMKDATIFDLAFPLAQQEMFNEDIFKALANIDHYFYYQGKKESIDQHKAFLIGKITGFIDALKNQIKMFYVLEPGILVIAQEQPSNLPESPQEKPKQTYPDTIEDEQEKPLAITDKDVQWAEEEFIIELDYYIMRYMESQHKRPSEASFKAWLQDYYNIASKGNFATWATRRLNPFSIRQAKAELQFTVDSIIFFISDYIPQTLISQDQKRSSIDWQTLKKTFPGFIIYENRDLFRYAGDSVTERTIAFLVDMVNQKLKKLSEDKSLGQLVLFEPASSQKFDSDTDRTLLTQALELASLLV